MAGHSASEDARERAVVPAIHVLTDARPTRPATSVGLTKDPTRNRAAKAAPRCITCGNIVAIRCRLTGSQACAGDKKSDAFAPSRRLLPAGRWVAFAGAGASLDGCIAQQAEGWSASSLRPRHPDIAAVDGRGWPPRPRCRDRARAHRRSFAEGGVCLAIRHRP